VVTHSPLAPVALVQLLYAALSSLTNATFLLGSLKCVATSKQWMTAVENCRCKLKCSRCGSSLEGLKRLGGSMCDTIKHGPCLSATEMTVSGSGDIQMCQNININI